MDLRLINPQSLLAETETYDQSQSRLIPFHFKYDTNTLVGARHCRAPTGFYMYQSFGEMVLPEEVFSARRLAPDDFVRNMRLAAAIYWYQKGEISQEKAAQIAGLNRRDFLAALAREQVDVFAVDFDDLQQELNRG